MRKLLTAKQRLAFNFIRQQIHNGLPPSFREIGEHFGFSVTRAFQLVRSLERKGYLTMEADKPRTLSLLPPYKDDTRGSLIVNEDLPQLNIQKGDFLLIDRSKPVTEGDVFLSMQGHIKRYSIGDTVFGKVVSCVREI